MNEKPTKRTPDLSQPVTTNTRAVIEVTNNRYQEDLFWAGPKGLAYGLVLGHKDWQVANAYPDANSTYFVVSSSSHRTLGSS